MMHIIRNFVKISIVRTLCSSLPQDIVNSSLGKNRIAILTGYRILRIVGDRIWPGTGYQIQFYANNQFGFVLSQLCFEDLII